MKRADRIGPSIIVSVLILFCGCKVVGPDYTPPALATPDAWSQTVAAEMASEKPQLLAWWSYFRDPKLEELIQRAGDSNLTLQQAGSRIRESRARYGVTRRALQPNIDASGLYSRSRASENLPPFNLIPNETLESEGTNIWSVGVDMIWELDVFGRVRRSIESSDAAWQSSLEDYRDILVSLLAEVARNYVEARTLQQRIAYAEENIRLQKETLELARARYESGLAGKLDPTQAESNLASTEAALPPLWQAFNLTLNRLAVLLGEQPGSLHDELSAPGAIPPPPSEMAVGIPANLLRQRPDLRRAERDIASQTARIGMATAELYPRFGLSGSFFLEGTKFTDLGDISSGSWALTPFFRVNLFNRNRIRDKIKIEEERTGQLLLEYEKTLLRALEEVENSTISYREERLRRDALRRAAEASKQAVELVETLYTSGLTEFQNVLDSQRSLFLQQDQLAASEGAVTRNVIALYKALGGGWSESTATPLGSPGAPVVLPAATPAGAANDAARPGGG